jgi:hypothetical protein
VQNNFTALERACSVVAPRPRSPQDRDVSANTKPGLTLYTASGCKYLFNVLSDPTQAKNVADEFPELVATMSAKLAAYAAESVAWLSFSPQYCDFFLPVELHSRHRTALRA